MPVSATGDVHRKYIHLQQFAKGLAGSPTDPEARSQRKAHIAQWKFYTVRLRSRAAELSRLVRRRGAYQWNRIPFVAAINAKVSPIRRNHRMAGVQFAHPDQAQIGQIRMAVAISLGEFLQLIHVLETVESQSKHLALHQLQNIRTGPQMKGGLGQDCLACQQRLGDAARQAERPVMMEVVSVGIGHNETGIGYPPHFRANPFRNERSRGPSIAPARRRNFCLPPFSRAASSCSRMIRPTGTPVRREVSLSHFRRSSVRRIVSV
jgi:hypothetical protein